ncbi:MAG: hypothetical protein P8Y25_02625 [Chromatiaceae bacterium]
MAQDYIHGYSREEQRRLIEQADVLAPNVFAGLDLAGAGGLPPGLCLCLDDNPAAVFALDDQHLAEGRMANRHHLECRRFLGCDHFPLVLDVREDLRLGIKHLHNLTPLSTG